MQVVKIQNAEIPALGFGTYGMGGPALVEILGQAIVGGFRHIDTAQIYRNESEVGAALAHASVPRSDIFVTTKVWTANYRTRLFEASVDDSLRKLRTDYIDLLLLHWPNPGVPLSDQIGALNETVAAGKVRHIGVSNFNRALMAEAVRLSKHPLVTNQFEHHPYLHQAPLIEATRRAGLAVTGYCSMAIGRVFSDPVLATIARSHRRSIAQVVLRWLVQQDGVIALSRTTNAGRITENVAVFDFELTPHEMSEIHSLAVPNSRIVDPPGLAPIWDE
jgi:2,5-diketo-D-gluconate reductase B